MKLNQLLNEMFLLLDQDNNIKKMSELKKKITEEEITLINDYRQNPSVSSKKKLYTNKIIQEYLTCENNINYLIMEINLKFKRSHSCESNKW